MTLELVIAVIGRRTLNTSTECDNLLTTTSVHYLLIIFQHYRVIPDFASSFGANLFSAILSQDVHTRLQGEWYVHMIGSGSYLTILTQIEPCFVLIRVTPVLGLTGLH